MALVDSICKSSKLTKVGNYNTNLLITRGSGIFQTSRSYWVFTNVEVGIGEVVPIDIEEFDKEEVDCGENKSCTRLTPKK